jgi:predicted amidohydrolase
MDRLTLGFLHLSIRHKDLAHNRQSLLSHAQKAAESGANIIIAPELSLSGYSFSSRQDISAYTESIEGETISAIKDLAITFGVYIIVGFAEHELATSIFYNSAIAISPTGERLCLYRKITAETRWACPGKTTQTNTISTPWGTVGLLICSDSYFGLIPRATALKGTDLLVVPSNWPALSLDPAMVWKARAIENNMFVAAANRGGEDLTMSCKEASSCVFSPTGDTLLSEKSQDSAIFYAELPLEHGRIKKNEPNWLATRQPNHYGDMYLDMRYASDLTRYYNLPKPGTLDIIACTKATMPKLSIQILSAFTKELKPAEHPRLLLLPMYQLQDALDLVAFGEWAKSQKINLCFGMVLPEDEISIVFIEASGIVSTYQGIEQTGSHNPFWIDLDQTRMALAFTDELIHPEFAMASAKLGCDLIVCPTTRLDESLRIALGAKTIEQVAVAVAGENLAFVAEPPAGHSPWKEYHSEADLACTASVSTESLRNKRFHERYDFELLLQTDPNQIGDASKEQPVAYTQTQSPG